MSDPMKAWYKCNICNVTSKGLIAHDKHLEGGRHKKNVAIATGEQAPQPQANTKKRAHGGSETKQERKKRLEQDAVARASLLLNPALQRPPSFVHRVLNWGVQNLFGENSSLPAVPVSAQFNSMNAYLSAWEPLILEEARAMLAAGFDNNGAKHDENLQLSLTLHNFQAAPEMSTSQAVDDPSVLAFSMEEAAINDLRHMVTRCRGPRGAPGAKW